MTQAARGFLAMTSAPTPPPDRLDIDPNSSVYRRSAQLAEPRLCLIRRAWDAKKSKHAKQISVEEVRKLNTFFHMSAADGGRRIVIVDAADEMNPSAANALLKTLEEPPQRGHALAGFAPALTPFADHPLTLPPLATLTPLSRGSRTSP